MSVLILNKKPKPAKKKMVEVRAVKDPKRIELDARRTLKQINEPIQEELELIIEGMRNKTPKQVGDELERVRKNADFRVSIIAEDLATKWVQGVNMYNRQEMMKILRGALGINIGAIVDEQLKRDLEVLIMENASYIKSIPDYLIGNVAKRVMQHFKGEPMPENRTLRQQIREEFKVSDGRAKVLARDQTSKMNTSLTQKRQTQLGIEWYVWKTVEDERVVGRPGGLYPKGTKLHRNHYIMQGKICKWDDPTVYSDDGGKTWKQRTEEMPQNAPGQDIMCRCRAAPYIDIEKLKVKWSE